MKLLVAALGALLIVTPAAAKSWTVDPASSKLGFTASMNGTAIDGTFKQWTAAIEFDPDNLGAAHAAVKVDLNSADTGNQQRDHALPGPEWFDASGSAGLSYAKEGPSTATFETTMFRAKGPGQYEADGILNLRGVANAVTLPFTLKIDGATAVVDGTAELDRTKWGIGTTQFADGETVATSVTVSVHLTATAQ